MRWVCRVAINEAKLSWLKMKEVQSKPVAILLLFPHWFRRVKGVSGKGQKWKAIGGVMPPEFTPDREDFDDEDFMEDAVREVPLEPSLHRLRGKQAPQTFENAEQEFRTRYLSSLQTWLRQQPRGSATSAAMMRYLRSQRGFSEFARSNSFYAKAHNIVTRFEGIAAAPGGSTTNPRIRAT